MPRTAGGRVVLAETGPPSRRARRVWRIVVTGLVLALLGAGFLGVRTLLGVARSDSCIAASAGDRAELSPEQAGNAAVIAALAMRRGLPERAATIAIATAMQESKLRNLRYGDRDSVGLFQQRPSQGWGTVEQILDPVYAAGAFYDRLVTVRDWQTRPLTEAAQAVQRSAYPQLYAQHESEARALAAALTGSAPATLTCELTRQGSAGSTAAVVGALRAHHGLAGTATDRSVRVEAAAARAWAVAAWAIAHADSLDVERVEVGGRTWSRDPGNWSDGGAVPAGAAAVVITVAR